MQWLLCIIFSMWVTYPLPWHLCWKVVPSDPNITSLGRGEYNCLSEVEHVIGEEKYEWVIW
jgi:hypothetical protein